MFAQTPLRARAAVARTISAQTSRAYSSRAADMPARNIPIRTILRSTLPRASTTLAQRAPPYLSSAQLHTQTQVRARSPSPAPRYEVRNQSLLAAPGGWTWVLASLGASVRAVDKAALDPRVAAMPGVEAVIESAFALPPEPVDWLVCDVIAYPARLLALVQRWIAAGAARRIVCSVKFQGATDHDTAAEFAALPGGVLRHLHHNKHELTFFWQRPPT